MAIQVTEKVTKFYFQRINGTSHRLYLNVFEGNDTTNTTLYNQYHLANLFDDSMRTEVILSLKNEYKPYGVFTYIKDVSTVDRVSRSEISWNQDTPEGTNVKVSTAIIDKEKQPLNEDWVEQPYNTLQILSIQEGENLANKNLHIKVELDTLNVEITPSLSNIIFEIMTSSEMQYIELTTDSLERFHNVEGEVTVEYDASKGNLRGAVGSVESFTVSFVPEDLQPKPSPYFTEGLRASLSLENSFTKVNYYLNQLEQETITAVVNVQLDLIHIDIINP